MTLARLFKDGNELKIVCGLIQCAAVVSTSPGRAAAAVGVVHRSALLCCACVRMYVVVTVCLLKLVLWICNFDLECFNSSLHHPLSLSPLSSPSPLALFSSPSIHLPFSLLSFSLSLHALHLFQSAL